MNIHKSLPACRSCGYPDVQMILSLGMMPLANSLLSADRLNEPESLYPLDLVFCPRCSLVQITETVPPDVLFSEYLYLSSFSETMLKHAKEMAQRLTKSLKLGRQSLVVEVGSNDGYLLQYFLREGIPVLGIEPAANVAKMAEDKGVPTLCEFFGVRSALKLRESGQKADVIIANNVLAHVADLNGVIDAINILLKEDGQTVIEVPYVKDMIDSCEFDTIYHEHLCYFSVTAVNQLLKRHNMLLVEVERIPIHGGSLRLFITHANDSSQGESVRRLLQEEKEWGVYETEFYLGFSQKVEQIRLSLLSLLGSLKQEGARIAAYGAAAKGTVMLNHCRLGCDTIDFVVDLNPYKQGHYIPGVHIPIKAPTELLAQMPEYTLLLAWNLKDEVLKQQSDYIKNGGKFILPLPRVKVL